MVPESSVQSIQPAPQPVGWTPKDLGPSLQGLVDTIKRHIGLIISIAIIGTLLDVSWTLRQKKIFEGTCTIEYDPNPAKPLGRGLTAESESNYPWLNEEWYQTQNRIIASRVIAERVVQKLELHKNPDFLQVADKLRKNFKGVDITTAAQFLQQRLKVEQIKYTRLVLIVVQDTDPKRAAMLANTVADVFIEKMLRDKLETTVSALEWLSTQLDGLKKDLDQSENALQKFKEQNNVLSLAMEERQNIIANDIQHFSGSLTSARTKHIELEARLKELQAAKGVDPLDLHLTIVAQNPTIEALRKEYREKFTEKEGLSVRFGDSHPQIKSLAARLSVLREQIDKEIQGLIAATSSDLREVTTTERGLRDALGKANTQGLELNLRELQYNRLHRERENNAKLYELVLQRTTETDLTRMMRVAQVRILDRAITISAPVYPRILINFAVGLVVSTVLGLGAAFVSDRMDRRLRTTDDAEALGLSVIGVLPLIEEGQGRITRKREYGLEDSIVDDPKLKDVMMHVKPMSSLAECCRTIRTNLSFMSPDQPPHSVVVTSGSPREGKTTILINLAIALAQSGKRVLVVDTDLRRPRIHRVFNLDTTIGITSVLMGEMTLEAAIQSTNIPNLFILCCGPIPPAPSELLHTAKFRELIARTGRDFDRVLFDSPPLGAVTDAAVIAPQVDGAIVICKTNSTTRDSLKSAMRQLNDVSARVLGVVMNEIDLTNQRDRYGYYYRQGYRPINNENEAPPEAPMAEA